MPVRRHTLRWWLSATFRSHASGLSTRSKPAPVASAFTNSSWNRVLGVDLVAADRKQLEHQA